MATCDDRAQSAKVLGPVVVPVVLTCPNGPNDRLQCQLAPVNIFNQTHAAGAHDVCNQCWDRVDNQRRAIEEARLTALVVARSTGPGPKYLYNGTGCRALLCRFCETDEIELFKQNTALNNPTPAANADGWKDTCTCRHRIRLHPSNTATMPSGGPRYCVRCRDNTMNEINAEATSNMYERQASTWSSDIPKLLCTTTWANNTRRKVEGRPIACRCGRDTLEATAHPRVTYCLCCGGVQVDEQHPGVKITRHGSANIRARAATPAGLPALQFTAAAFNLGARGVRLPFPRLGVCNNAR